ncbi:MAG TPA: acetolactate synthase small subunit [Candidatus Limnocylindrales bacterium]|nr:acetolactate synthase small subunit [Candidatus Limnocylindrales bacterium]
MSAPSPTSSPTPSASTGPSPTPSPSSSPGAPAPAQHAARYVPGSGETGRHVIAVIVRDRPGVLNRVASLLRARTFNIASLAVGRSETPGLSRMTIVLNGDDYGVEQVSKQLYRLIDVLKVQDLTAERSIEHELALLKVRATNANRAEILKLVELSRGRVVDLAADSVVVEVAGPPSDVEALVEQLSTYGLKELVRTGSVVMLRGSQSIEHEGAER